MYNMRVATCLMCVLCACLVQAATFKASIQAVKKDSAALKLRREKLREEGIARARRNSHRVQTEKRDARQQLLRSGLFADLQNNERNLDDIALLETQKEYHSDVIPLWVGNRSH